VISAAAGRRPQWPASGRSKGPRAACS
jgi:hypothetical protein